VGSDDANLYAINPDSTLKWKNPTGGAVDSSPAIGSDGTIYVGSNDNYLYAISVVPLSATSITTNSGTNTGPVSITDLAGSGFVGGTTVRLSKLGQSAINASNITVISSTQIACTFDLTGQATGYWDVVVSTGGINATLPAGFQITPLAVTSITPASGINTGPESITDLAGGGFVSGTTVWLSKLGQSAINASNITVISSTQIACSFDLTGQCTGYWDVVASTGGISATLSSGFQITAPTTTTTTINSGNTIVTPGSGGSVTITPPSGQIMVNISAGTFNQNVNVTLSTGVVPASTNPTIKVGDICLEITNDLNLQPGKPVTITVRYRASDIAGMDVSNIVICRYDQVHNLWIPLPTTIDTVNKIITATTDHFSMYVVVELEPAANLNNVKAYPMPYYPARGNLTIENLTENATIKIYTITGELVKTVSYASSNGVATWDGKNNNGAEVASGVYIMYIESSAGKQRLKIAVER
jgi:hypothetical protein